MTEHATHTTVGELPTPTSDGSPIPAVCTRGVWALFLASVLALAWHVRAGASWAWGGLVAVDGLTVLLWVGATFVSGVVHSYARRYTAGHRSRNRFFAGTVAFTLAVVVLVAAAHLALFVLAWLAMGLAMASLIGHVDGWDGAAAAGRLARRHFLASTAAVGIAAVALWWATGTTTIGGVASAVEGDAVRSLVVPGLGTVSPVLLAAVALVLAAAIQSALVPFHTWLLSSMTAPTPASALMHAGFVNAGGLLLVRFAPVVSVDSWVLLAVVALGAASALFGKFAKAVQADAKGALGCSTVGQMGFMLVQAGLGFFAAAVAHLLLHGCYKAYQFLSAGDQVEQVAPESAGSTEDGLDGITLADAAVVGITALAAGSLFAVLTGKGPSLGGGLVLTLLVTLLVVGATREVVGANDVPPRVRYAAVPLVALPAIAVYAAVYRAVEHLLASLPGVGAPVAPGPAHAVLGLAFVLAYLVHETGVHRRSTRLYVALLNASRPARGTVTATTEDQHEY